MHKFTFTRAAIIEETYVIEAETEAEAYDIIRDNPDQPVVHSEFLDWYTDDFVCADGDTVCEDCLSTVPKKASMVTMLGRIVCLECVDSKI